MQEPDHLDDAASDVASDVSHEDSTVIIDGPDGVAVTMTPRAALATAGRLQDAALDALIAQAEEAAEPAPPEPEARPA